MYFKKTLLLFLFALPCISQANDALHWVWIDTANKQLKVMENKTPIKVFTGAAFGRGGIGQKLTRGDRITPKGIYKIGWENPNSQYKRFFGLTYPSIKDANIAIIRKKISQSEYDAIVEAHKTGKVPPQNTRLGGQVGIHGLGKKDINVHKSFDWTFGCIALTNEQILELSKIISVGELVVIS